MTSSLETQSDKPLVECLKYGAGTDIGLRREENQDSFGVIENSEFKFYMVADGMGGVKGGAIASTCAVKVISEYLKPKNSLSIDQIKAAVQTANAEIFDRGEREPSLSGMGTTLVAAGFFQDKLVLANVGDSRCYRVRRDRISQLSEDHTLVRELIQSGTITPDQAENHPVAHMLTRSLGPTPTVDVDCWISEDGPAAGDLYVLCSDGLYNLVGSRDMIAIIKNNSLDDAIQELIELANNRGGTDNITIIIVQISEDFHVKPEQFPHETKETSIGLEDTAELYFDKSQLDDQVQSDTKHDFHDAQQESPQIRSGVNFNHEASDDQKLEQNNEDVSRARKEVASGVETRWFPLTLAQVEVLSILVIGVVFGVLVTTVFRGADSSQVQLAGKSTELKPESMLSSSGVIAPKPLSAEIARVRPSLGQVEGELPLLGRINLVPSLADQDLSDTLIGGEQLSVYNGLSRHEVENITRRKQVLRNFIQNVSSKLSTIDKPIGGEIPNLLKSATKERDKLKSELERIQVEMDKSARRLAIWYGRQKRLQNSDPINLASEVSVASDRVKEKKEIFERATWAYLQAAEVLRYNPSDTQQENKVKNLMKVRKLRMIELANEVSDAIEEEVRAADRQIAELTLQRDGLESQFESAQQEVEYVQILIGSDQGEKDRVRSELENKLSAARLEHEELEQLLPTEREVSAS